MQKCENTCNPHLVKQSCITVYEVDLLKLSTAADIVLDIPFLTHKIQTLDPTRYWIIDFNRTFLEISLLTYIWLWYSSFRVNYTSRGPFFCPISQHVHFFFCRLGHGTRRCFACVKTALTSGAWHLETPACFISLSASLSTITERYHLCPGGVGVKGGGTKATRQHLLSLMAADC